MRSSKLLPFCSALLMVAWIAITPSRFSMADDAPVAKPNIIFILCDDLGWGDLGVFHQNESKHDKKFSTPNLDTMATSGAQLRNHYCPAPVCAPSRASLLTGRHQGHASVRDNQFDKALPQTHTIASVLKSAGYTTAIIGKYGLQGFSGDPKQKPRPSGPEVWPAYPTKRGFDEFFGYVRHVDGHVHYPADRWELGNSETHKSPKELWHNDQEISDGLETCYTTDLFTARAKHWIAAHQSESDDPFFLYLAYDTPHAALQVPSCPYPAGYGADAGVQWIGKPGQMINTATGKIDSFRHPETQGKGWSDEEERFATMVRRIDNGVGDLLQTLQDLGIGDNTLVVLSSDNGPHHESYLASSQYDPTSFQSYGPFDGTKRDTWEGGIRVPTLAHWPAKIPAGTIDTSPSQFHDWMATFADAAGISPPALCDGVSLVPSMTAKGQRTDSTIYVEYAQNGRTKDYDDFEADKRGQKRGQMQVIHADGYKGVRVNIQRHADNFRIFDLSADPKELNDLADSSDAMRLLQQKMKDRVTQLRRPNGSAQRPYDDAMVAAVELEGVAPGAILVHGAVDALPYVPQSPGSEPVFTKLKAYDIAPTMSADSSHAAARLTAYLKVPEDGSYKFELMAQQPTVLRLHDMVLLENETTPAPDDGDAPIVPPTNPKASVQLSQGYHPIQIHFGCPDGALDWSLRWSRDGDTMEEIPADQIVIPATN